MATLKDSNDANVVMSVSELHGRVVVDEDGERLGVVRDVVSADDGRITDLEVRGRWMLGSSRTIPASGMRMEDGEIVVPRSAVPQPTQHERSRVAPARAAGMPMLLSGREGARGRFGGVDVIGSLFGALVAIASLVLIGGVLAAIFGADGAVFDTSIDSFGDVFNEATIIGAVTLFTAFLLGGWAAGRSSRFDGPANGMLVTVWFLLIALALGGLTAWLGNEYDVLAATNLPQFSNDDWAVAGAIGALIALGLMLLGGAIGGALGEGWHRRADRAMLDVVPVSDAPSDQVVASDEDASARRSSRMD
ncbi:MAG: hypothetical protein JWM25_446 [Thermoleophilia bacterium]|nr:hypothetical protein [Thermoleophilia bacterium]